MRKPCVVIVCPFCPCEAQHCGFGAEETMAVLDRWLVEHVRSRHPEKVKTSEVVR